MAQTNVFSIIASSDMTGIPEDISDAIFHLAPWETPLLNRVGMNSLKKPCSNPTHIYQEIQERPTRTTLNTAINNSTTTVILNDNIAESGDLIQIDEELILLGTKSTTTFSSCTRSAGTGAAAAHLINAPILVLGNPQAQGSAASTTTDHVIYPNQVTTYTQIFTKDIVVSGTGNALDRFGRGPGDELAYVANRQLMVVKKELENSLLWGYSAAPSSTTTAGQFDGVYERVGSVNATDLSDAAITLANLRTGARTICDYGGDPDALCVSLYTADVLDSMGQAHIQHVTDPLDPVYQTYGGRVSRLFVSGKVMDILPMDTIHAQAFMLSSSVIGCGPLQGRQFHLKQIASDGDREKLMVIGEYTVEVPTPRAHYIWTSVKFS